MSCFWLSGFFNSDAGTRVILCMVLDNVLECSIICNLLTLAGRLSAGVLPLNECRDSNNDNNIILGGFPKYMQAGDQKQVILLEWPKKRKQVDQYTCIYMHSLSKILSVQRQFHLHHQYYQVYTNVTFLGWGVGVLLLFLVVTFKCCSTSDWISSLLIAAIISLERGICDHCA